MKKLTLIFFVLLSIMSYGQTKVNFSSFDAWKQNSTSKKMEFAKKINEPGYIEFNNENSTVIVFNIRRNQKELFQFMPFKKVDGGHYIGFGKVDTKQMMTFIPQDKLLFLKVNDIVIMKFDLSITDTENILSELKSI
ncbi:MAG: hypothetical protein QM478_03265 [Flavobacteriaceae bacterium]